MKPPKFKFIKAKSQRDRRKDAKIKTIIIHSTDGRKAGDIQVLTKGNVSVHWYITRTGELYHFVDNSKCAYHAGMVLLPEHSNDYTIGIELEHIDGKDDWPIVQIQKLAELILYLRSVYGELPIKSHAEVAYPKGRKVDPKDFPWKVLSEEYKKLKLR